MRIKIVSSFVLANPDDERSPVWEGNISEIGFSGHVGETNERIYRYFNRVEATDTVRLDYIGYKLPSLSAGDLVVWLGDENKHSQMFLVDGVGFVEITPGLGLRRETIPQAANEIFKPGGSD